MNLFPCTVVDNFFEFPEQVLELAKSVEYHEPGYTYYPGVVSKQKINDLNRELFEWVIDKVIHLYWDMSLSGSSWDCSMEFQKIEPYKDKDHIFNKGSIHRDSRNSILSGLIYLNKNGLKDSGTSLYKRKNPYYNPEFFYEHLRQFHGGNKMVVTDEVPTIEALHQQHYDNFIETMRIQYEYNRLLVIPPDVWHASTTFGEETRYTLRFFIRYLNCDSSNYPLLRI